MPSGNEAYRIVLEESVIKKDIPKLPKTIKEQAKKAIREKIAIHPLHGKALHYSWKGHRRLRIGNYRIIYRIDEQTKIIYIVSIKHRKDVYD